MTTGLRFTSRDLECFPDIEGVRYEIIDGELYVSRAPQLGHQYACGKVFSPLDQWSEQTGIGRPYLTPGLVFSEDNEVIPDLIWVTHARLAEVIDDKGHLRAAPELVVEVLSPGRVNELRDRELKLELYSRQGVQEYWIVDWRRQAMDVYRYEGDALRLATTLHDGDVLTSPLFPGFTCAVSTFWQPLLG
jgi:Uma2 family endonuclease